jgi:DNA-damage-inducible protein D
LGNKISNLNQTVFEQIKRLDENNNEYWTARDISMVLEYSEYRHFKPVIDKAKEACKNSGYMVLHHFEDILDMIELGKGAKRKIENVKLSRYACYLVVQNADPAKEIVAAKNAGVIDPIDYAIFQNHDCMGLYG